MGSVGRHSYLRPRNRHGGVIVLSDLIDDEFAPEFGAVEDYLLAVLRPLEAEVPDLRVVAYIEADDAFSEHQNHILARRVPGAFANASFGSNEERFVQRGMIRIETFTNDGQDGNGDLRGSKLQEICRRRLLTVYRKQVVVPGVGHLCELRNSSPAHRTSDWQSSTGVVQYANLPHNMHRYETTYGIIMRPASNPVDPLAIFQ